MPVRKSCLIINMNMIMIWAIMVILDGNMITTIMIMMFMINITCVVVRCAALSVSTIKIWQR